MHRRMAGTRGGAVGIVQLGDGTACFSGLGNVAASILSQGRAAVILHSDGISARWEAAALPGLETRDPLLIAAVLLAEAGIHRDDAGILVLKP
jgi:hypothetical protein